MIKRILVPLDGSKLAEAALTYAEEIARNLNAEITLISVSPDGGKLDKEQYMYLHKSYMQEMENRKKHKAISIKSAILTGDPAEQIVKYSEKNNDGLIVMGTRGMSPIKRWMLGSVADKVVNMTSIPIALISTEDSETRVPRQNILRKALVILEGTEGGEVIIPFVTELASSLHMEVTLIQLVDEALMYYEGTDYLSYVPVRRKVMNSRRAKARSYLTKLALPLKSNSIPVTVRTAIKGDPASTIVKVANRIDADLLIMAVRGRSGISRWFFGSIRDEVINTGDMLVLLLKARD
ncbi:universal stress protein [Chloroflexota bacterium]